MMGRLKRSCAATGKRWLHAAVLSHFDERMGELWEALGRSTVMLERLQQPAEHVGSVLLCWQENYAPLVISRTVVFTERGQTHDVPFQHATALPAGAWVVPVGCSLVSVRNGLQVEDLGLLPRGSLALLHDGVALGQLVNVTVRSPLPATCDVQQRAQPGCRYMGGAR